ncbi:hypothetical protein LCGC14_2269940 [marine sediment metagenome]|uniref:CSD domain-containing protein n=1 Tax=marine sediment metagenome TaxID=412755 RepID=A0A0F9F9N8_9ZZZZ
MGRGGLKPGTVKWFDAERGFGFIIPDEEDGKDVWFHVTRVGPANDPEGSNAPIITNGDRVLFQAVEHDKGPKALRVVSMVEREDICPTCGHWL